MPIGRNLDRRHLPDTYRVNRLVETVLGQRSFLTKMSSEGVMATILQNAFSQMGLRMI